MAPLHSLLFHGSTGSVGFARPRPLLHLPGHAQLFYLLLPPSLPCPLQSFPMLLYGVFMHTPKGKTSNILSLLLQFNKGNYALLQLQGLGTKSHGFDDRQALDPLSCRDI